MDFKAAMKSTALAYSLAAALMPTAHAADAPACTARSGAATAPLIELYTSEGCNSCPPADRWLSRFETRPGIVALAYHVDYWDRLGWTDRFAHPQFTRRQAEQRAVNGARFSYTPQVVVDGRDRTDWPRLDPDGNDLRPPAPVAIALSSDGRRVVASVTALAGAPPRLAAYWAVTESNHVSDVKAGENHGITLHHDFVVREHRAVPAWNAAPAAAHSLSLVLPGPAAAAHPRRINLVVTDAATGRPVQAVALAC